MPETRTPLIPGAETEEGKLRISKALDERHNIDFRAFRMLRQLVDEGFLNYQVFHAALKEDCDPEEARECAKELDDEISQIIRDRIMSDHEVLAALAGEARMIHVHYSDGSSEQYNDVAQAEEGISETVIGCDFATTVESIDDDDGREICLVYSLKLDVEEK